MKKMFDKKLIELYARINGWTKCKGYRVDKTDFNDDFPIEFFEANKLSDLDFIKKGSYWSKDEDVVEDVEEIIDIINEYADTYMVDTFDEWKKKYLEVKSQTKLEDTKSQTKLSIL